MAGRWLLLLRRYGFIAAAILAVVVVAGGLIWFGLRRPHAAGNGQAIPQAQSQDGNEVTSGGAEMARLNPVSVALTLSEGKPQPQAAANLPLSTGEPLPADQTAQLLNRLPALPVDPNAQADFKLPQGPLPPPRAGETVQQPFPPQGQATPPPAAGEAGPLQVLRYAPEGEISIAPFASVTFNQPMVAVDTQADLSASQVPARIEPALPGTWRWLGTRTLTFQYDSVQLDRLPKATAFKITIPAGTKSANGATLAESVSWTFTTPPPKVVATYPKGESQPLDPLFFISFDQRVDPAAVLPTLHVEAGRQAISFELVDEAGVQADAQGKALFNNALPGHWVAFRSKGLLPGDATVNVTVGPGTPSAEGPLVTKDTQAYSFKTYSPLKIVDHGCSYNNSNCPPLTHFYIRFNNPIDPKIYTDAMLKIDPAVPGASANLIGDTLAIQGETRGRTTYTVTVDGAIQDTFGQKLGQTAVLTFKVGSASPMLAGSGQTFVTLDPASAKPVFSVYSMNYASLNVAIYAVQPSDWPAFKAYLRDWQQGNSSTPPGRRVVSKSLPVEAPADSLGEVDIDLSQVMDGHFGQFIVIVSPPQGLFKANQNLRWQTIQTWVQVTQIGLDAFSDQSHLVVWASALKDGRPLGDVTIQAGSMAWGKTGDDGVAHGLIPAGAAYLVASLGADQALLPHSSAYWGDDTWNPTVPMDRLRWYIFDDRGMYRPGEEVHIKGWLRRIGAGPGGDVGLVGNDVTGATYQVTESQGNAIGNGQVKVNALGGFDFAFKIPDTVNLGWANVNFQAQGDLGSLSPTQASHAFQIQEFRRPEFEVTARNETNGPYFSGGSAVVAAQASYYAGGPLPNAGVTWQVTSSPASYAPPNWPGFTFGTWVPWWYFSRAGSPIPGGGKTGKVETFTGKTDAGGMHYLKLDFTTSGDPRPVSLVAEATVMDVNRQAWTGATTLLVHPSALYVGLRTDRYFVEKGTPLKVGFIVADLDGNPKVDRQVEIQAARLDWKYTNGSWQEVAADTQTCNQASMLQPGSCTFQTPVGGTYQITATVTDEQGRKNQSQLTRWVSGGSLPPARQLEQETVTLIPDKEAYQPGDTAQILVQSPFTPAEGLLTVSRSGLVSTQRFHLENGSTTLQVPVQEKDIPNLVIQVDLSGSAPRIGDDGQVLKDAPLRPAFATGKLDLKISLAQRTLSVQVIPDQAELEPGGTTSLSLSVKDATGRPVAGAEVAVVVVDEAILALTNYQIADPLAAFYSDRPGNLSSIYARSSVVLANPQSLTNGHDAHMSGVMDTANKSMLYSAGTVPAAAPMATSAPAAEGAAGTASQPIQVRSDFNPLALFSAAVVTDASGEARVAVKLPDNLTRYRVMAVAVAQDKYFGQAENHLTARLPLMVRLSAPRFLNFGDTFELPVVLQNQTDQPLEVLAAVRGSNLQFTGATGLKVTVPARDRIEIRFPADANRAGTATIQVAAASGSFADAATVSLPVYTPATTEAFATYGVIDHGSIVQPVATPKDVFPQYGGVEVTTSSTALQALTDAVLYLIAYPYECSEQLASRVLAVSALRDVLSAFQAQGLPAPADMEAAVNKDIVRLRGMQNDDGGFPTWAYGDDSNPFDTIHVAHALYRAQAKGFAVPQVMTTKALDYLQQIENHYPSWYTASTRHTLSAYALYVRALYGDRDTRKASLLLNEAGMENLDLAALGWLWPVLDNSTQVDALRRYINNRVVETAGAANFTTTYDEQNYLLLGSDRRTDAILLDALIGDNPQSDLIPKLVNGLLAQRVKGHWDNTQEDVFILLALDRYFNTFEAQTPDFVARVWMGSGYAGDATYQGRTTQRQETDIPMSYLVAQADSGTQALTISKEGNGRLYYRIGLRYAPSELILAPLDNGFVVQRTYEAVDNPADVSQDANGAWHIKAGARVRVKISLVADNRRYNVALVDPLPAGLEIINPSLAVSGSVPQDPSNPNYKYGWWWWGTWYEHQNMRDNQAEAFTSMLWDGVYQYSYIARATTPGRFVVPPTKAEEMYSPEVFGRSGSNVVVIH